MNFGPEGFRTFPADSNLIAWAKAARVQGIAAANDAHHDHWWRHQRTWFVGVDALGNAADGSVSGVPLGGAAVDATKQKSWHKAQLSIIRPGYPKQDPNESDAAHRFRRDRDAAHLDGLLPIRAEKRRKMHEPHAFILGIALNEADSGASPLVVWPGSHRLISEVFNAAFAGLSESAAADTDMTEAYQTARRSILETCPRVPVPLRPGEAVLLHPMMIHGVSPWSPDATAAPEGRMIVYFRPLTPLSDWLNCPV